MGPSRRHVVLGLAALTAAVSAARAQQAQTPRIGYVYPAGGQQGTTFEVTVGGQALDGVNQVHVSGTGVKAAVIEHIKPINQGQVGMLRERLQELLRSRDANAVKEIEEIRTKIATFLRRPASPVIAESVRVQVTVAPGAEPGQRELKLGTPIGLSNPRVFRVGQLAEFAHRASISISDIGNLRDLRNVNLQRSGTATREANIALPAVVNGQIMPGGVDRYRFQASKGQRLVVAACARELIPYLADAVPGWFQAAITLYDARGSELAHADHFRFHPDPVLCCELPRDGLYVLEIRDSIYRGREDFVYRVTVGGVPFVTGIFPLGGKAGTQTQVEVFGWNLPAATVMQDARDKGPGVHMLSALKGEWVSNQVPFAVDTLPECLEKAPNNSRETAQQVSLPIIVNGRIDQPGQWDVFRFEGRAGEEVVAEVNARRLGSPLDSVLKLTDAAGKQLALNDDHEDKGSGLDTHHADSRLRARLPAGGTYFVHLGEAQNRGGREYAYRLRISAPRPDFELRVAPSSINLRPGTSVPITVCAVRKDGFSDEILLSLKGVPAGFLLGGGRVPPGHDQVRATLTAPATPLQGPLAVSIEGRAVIGGSGVVRAAVPCEDMMQAFAYRHLVPCEELEVVVSGRPGRGMVRMLSATPVKVPLGGTARVRVGLPMSTPSGQLQVELDDPPEGITIQKFQPAAVGSEIVLQADAAKAKAGVMGNLIVNVFVLPAPPTSSPARPAPAASTQAASAPAAAPPPRPSLRRYPWGTLPAIPFEVVAEDRRAGRPAGGE